GKPARLVTEGEATEADKAIVESLFEPLLHVLRNALDHGIESAEVRAAAGKPPSATIRLRASRQGDRVHVEVEDDGGGVDLARVREVALQRGEALGDRRREAGAGEVNVVIAEAGGELGGLEVDRLGERMDVMLKPMEGLLAGAPGVAGTTLLGDGRVLIVLDLQELLQ